MANFSQTLAFINMRILFTIIFWSTLHFCSGQENKTADNDEGDITIEYKIYDTDTIIGHFTRGQYGTKEYISYDSSFVRAKILLPDYSTEYSTIFWVEQLTQILKLHNIQECSLYKSIECINYMPYSYQTDEMKATIERDYIGFFKLGSSQIKNN